MKTAVYHERKIPERRLGRHLRHDPRSREFPAQGAPLKNTRHRHHGGVLNQGNLGSCTGNAMVDCLMTKPDWKPGIELTEDNAVKIYSLATQLDDFAGTYPPDDSGSSGLGAAKAAKQMGLISQYRHTFSFQQMLEALVIRPVMVGVNWYSGFDQPGSDGRVFIHGFVRGGHEFCLVGFNVNARTVTALNSWGEGWGHKGFFTIGWADMERLLKEDGDCTVPIP